MADSDFQAFLDEVMLKNDIVDIISEYTVLKRSGSRMMGLCPLHNDRKSPSLTVSPEKQVFHCFGCGAGGSVIQFIEAAMNLDFMDSVRYLADRAHIPVPENRGENVQLRKRRAEKKELIYKINADAARFYYDNLLKPEGRPGLDYLRNRQISFSTIKKFGIGFAAEGWNNLINFLSKKGYTENDMFAAGLVKRRNNGSFYDAFYDGRVIFPIIDVRGNVIAFGGRIINDKADAPKYWNTPETEVFKKKDNLFGLNLAKNSKSGRLLLMEGYMDVVSLHQNGFDNAAASLGTAFTREQARLVKRYAGRVVLCYDSDEAGKKATVRAGDILAAEGVKVRVLSITDGKDPDEAIKSSGAEMFAVTIEKAKPYIEYRIDELRRRFDLDDIDDRVDFMNAAAEILSTVGSTAQREIYINRISEELGISSGSIAEAVNEISRKRAGAERRRQENKILREINRAEHGEETALYNAEKLLLSLMLDGQVFKEVLKRGVVPEDFTSDTLHKKLAALIFELYSAGAKTLDAAEIIGRCAPEDAGRISDILLKDADAKERLNVCRRPLEIILTAKENRERQRAVESGNQEELSRLFEQKRNKKN